MPNPVTLDATTEEIFKYIQLWARPLSHTDDEITDNDLKAVIRTFIDGYYRENSPWFCTARNINKLS